MSPADVDYPPLNLDRIYRSSKKKDRGGPLEGRLIDLLYDEAGLIYLIAN